MIVVVVTQQDKVNTWQILQPHTGSASTAWANPRNRTGAHRPHRIRQDIQAGLLNQHGRVIDQRYVQFTGRHRLGWLRRLHVVYPARAWFRAAGEFPAGEIEPSTRLNAVRIMKPLSIEMLRE